MNNVKNSNSIEIDGIVINVLPNTTFLVKLDNSVILKCHLGGKLRLHYIKILNGDKVKVEVSPYDLSQGRIIYRYKLNPNEDNQQIKEKNES